MIPGEAMMFTIYGMIDDWRLMNTMLGLGIVYIGDGDPLHDLDAARIRRRACPPTSKRRR